MLKTSSMVVLVGALSAAGCAPTWNNTVRKPEVKARKATRAAPPAPRLPPEFSVIAELEDRRSFGDGKLVTMALTANSPAVRQRALLALGRIQAVEGAEALIKGLSDPDAGARAEAAFSIGLLGLSWQGLPDGDRSRLVDAVRAAEQDEKDALVQLALLGALGRLGTDAAVDVLVSRLSVPGDVQWRSALSLAVAAKNGAELPARAMAAVSVMIKRDAAMSTRFGGAYLLMQAKVPAARPGLLSCVGDDVSDVRAVCAKGLGDVGIDSDAVALRPLLGDPDYRVAVEATRALAKLAGRCKSAACPAIGALQDVKPRAARLLQGDTSGGAQPLLALAQTGLPASGRPLLVDLRRALLDGVRGVTDAAVRQDVANVECRLAAAIDRLGGTVKETIGCGGGLVNEAHALSTTLRELAQSPLAYKFARDFSPYLLHADSRVRAAAIEALGNTRSQEGIDRLRPYLNNPDAILAADAAAALAKLKDKTSIPGIRELGQKAIAMPDIAPQVADALATLGAKEAVPDLEQWLKSSHAGIRNAAAEALSTLTDKKVFSPNVERPVDPVKPPAVPRDAKVLFKTAKGDIEVMLYSDDTPLTALNIYTLAKKGAFNGLGFHRIVPNFVAQGGDPRGDGEGGPGYTIRCEVGHNVYKRGVVGMALSGKDTGGSQFFITHSPQPHLDGRYTAFGEVTKGMEVVDALLEGDRIIEARVTP